MQRVQEAAAVKRGVGQEAIHGPTKTMLPCSGHVEPLKVIEQATALGKKEAHGMHNLELA